MFGRLTFDALKHDWIEYAAGLSMLVVGLVVIGLITYHKRWKWLWTEWLSSVDHKKIGVMYILFAALQLAKGLIDAIMMRAQQAFAAGEGMGYLGPDHYQQIFTAHGVTMIFFVSMGVVFGIINLVLPLQIGARDVAFPFLNNLSFWLYAAGGMYIFISLIIGTFAGTGWTAYPPLSGLKYSPSVGVDYWLWSIQISGVGSLISGINFLVTILKMRCPGMSLKKMPIFVWATLATTVLVIFAFPILTATVGMLTTDRLLDTKLFTASYGGNPHDVYQSDMGMGTSGSLHINLTDVWGVLRDCSCILSEETFWIHLNGVGNYCDYFPFFCCLAPPLLYNGGWGKCECFFWDHDDDYRCPDGG